VTMVWVVSRSRLKLETSFGGAKNQTTVIELTRSPRWRGPHHVRESTS
jgi:hypothetical protein